MELELSAGPFIREITEQDIGIWTGLRTDRCYSAYRRTSVRTNGGGERGGALEAVAVR